MTEDVVYVSQMARATGKHECVLTPKCEEDPAGTEDDDVTKSREFGIFPCVDAVHTALVKIMATSIKCRK